MLFTTVRNQGVPRDSADSIATLQAELSALQSGRCHLGLLSRRRPHSALHVTVVEALSVCAPKKSGGIRITVNYQKLNKVTEILRIAIPRVDEVLDTLGGGSVFSVFDIFSGFTQLTIHPDTIPLTAFCTPNGLYEWLRMPQGAAGAPACFVSVMRLVTAGLDNIRMYLEDAIGSDDSLIHHVVTLVTFFARLRLHSLKLSPDKSRIDAARVDVLGHIISADGVRPNDDRIAALTRMPMPTDIKQLRSLLGGLSYYRKFLPHMAHHIRPITALLKKGAAFDFTSAMENTVRALLAELAAPPILVFPDWDAVTDTSRPFRLHCDASTAGLGATLEQEQPDAPYAPSSMSAEPPSTMNRTGPLWNSKPDASCGVLDASDVIYSVCTSSSSPTISASSKFARSERPNRAFNAGWNFFRPLTSASPIDENKKR